MSLDLQRSATRIVFPLSKLCLVASVLAAASAAAPADPIPAPDDASSLSVDSPLRLALAEPGASESVVEPSVPDAWSNPPDYNGGRGLITLEGVSGMFLNPTSGTLPRGTFTAQYCAAVLHQNDDDEIQHTAMFGYGLTDWLEVGGFFRISELDNVNHDVGAGGPYARLRLLRDESWWPEASVGIISRNGHETLRKQTLFAAVSKRFPIDEEGVLRGVRLHAGFRQIWQDSDVNEANGSIVYAGGEIELPWDLYVVGEVSNKDDVFEHVPYSFGVQWRPHTAFGLSVAGVQTGGEDRISLYTGIGISFEF